MRQYLSIIFFILIVYRVNGQNSILNNSSYDAETINTICLKSLDFLKVDSVLIYINDLPAGIVTNGIKLKGTLTQQSRTVYAVYIACGLTRKQLKKVLIHELVHVQQYFTGELRDCKETGNKIFRGRIFNQKDNYQGRRYEREANWTAKEIIKKIEG